MPSICLSRRTPIRAGLAAALLSVLPACGGGGGFVGAPVAPLPGAKGTIKTLQGETAFANLSDYRMLRQTDGRLEVNDGVVPYDLNTPLFSDYALKFRTIWMPDGASAAYAAEGAFDFPVGTVITKTFSFPADLRSPDVNVSVVETRVLIRQAQGWIALPYVWDADGKDATLKETGATYAAKWVHTDGSPRSTTYLVPNVNQCKECHGNIDPEDPKNEKKKVLGVIGPRAKHLNKSWSYGETGDDRNQLTVLADAGYLTGLPADLAAAPALVRWDDADADLESRARALLDANCAHCHNAQGTAAGSKLLLAAEVTDPVALGVCSSPIRSIDENRPTTFDIDPGNPDQSAVYVRMDSDDPEVMMPRLGRSLIFEEGVAVIHDWIAAMPGDCTSTTP